MRFKIHQEYPVDVASSDHTYKGRVIEYIEHRKVTPGPPVIEKHLLVYIPQYHNWVRARRKGSDKFDIDDVFGPVEVSIVSD